MKDQRMVTIDGTCGEGGGQVLRTALSLAALTGTPFRIENIRGRRRNPGLRQQHLTCVQAAAALCEARVEGGKVGSGELLFRPGHTPAAGKYAFAIATAGSTSLVLQTVLPVLAALDAPSSVSLTGGTHNPMAPPVPFLQASFLPVLSHMGFHANVTLRRYGFYPKGGGQISCDIAPRSPGAPLDLAGRLPVTSRRAAILLAGLPDHIALRERQILLAEGGLGEEEIDTLVLAQGPPGNTVWLTAEQGPCTALFTGFGQRGKPAEQVAREALVPAAFHQASGYAVEEHLADQLLLYLAIRGDGRFAASRLNLHGRTNMEIIRLFLPVTFRLTPLEGEAVLVTCGL
ncbi:MAG: RNA 3'-terminal phosphate cyclase [Thermodesulfobacteriota bacterium]